MKRSRYYLVLSENIVKPRTFFVLIYLWVPWRVLLKKLVAIGDPKIKLEASALRGSASRRRN
jgi:hypothetical protein